jgi:DHA1 family tetracycline resistance protein-like MFS transporter
MTHPPRKGSLLVIFLTVFIDLLGFGMVLPLLPIYGRQFAAKYGWADEQVGWTVGLLMSSFSAMQFLFLPIWGRASDRFGRRPILLIGLAGSTVFYLGFAIATSMQSLGGLFVTRIGAGIAGATIATAAAYIADTTTKEKRAKGMALVGAAFALGFTLGPSLGVVALLAGGDIALSPWPGYLASALSGLAFVLAAFLLPESIEPGLNAEKRSLFDLNALRDALSIPTVGLLLGTSFVAVFSFANFESTLSLQIEKIVHQFEAAPEASGALPWLIAKSRSWGYDQPDEIKLVAIFAVFAYLGLTLTLAQGFLVRRLADKLSEGVMATIGGIAATTGFLLLARAATNDDFNLLLIAMAIEVVGFAFVNPSLQSLLSRRSRADEQGGILGLGQSVSSLARIMGPVAGIRLFAYRPDSPYYFAAVLMALAVVAILWTARHGRDADG